MHPTSIRVAGLSEGSAQHKEVQRAQAMLALRTRISDAAAAAQPRDRKIARKRKRAQGAKGAQRARAADADPGAGRWPSRFRLEEVAA